MSTKPTLPARSAEVFGIRQIRVEQLFGQPEFTYELQLTEGGPATPRLMILYGDNGSGKTTVLRLIVHLLSHVDGKGHKEVVSKIRFKKLAVSIGVDAEVGAYREDISRPGFHAYIRKGSDMVAEADFYFTEQRTEEERSRGTAFLEALSSLDISLFFLADDRKVTSNVEGIGTEEQAGGGEYFEVHGDRVFISHEERHKRHPPAALDLAVARLSRWATQRAIRGSTQGEDDVNTIYTKIIQRLATRSRRKKAQKDENLEDLVKALQEQVIRSETFSQFGLTSVPKIQPLTLSILRAPKNAHDVISKVLSPWINSIKARLDAQQDVQKALSAFTELMNGFYSNKSVSFDVRRGISICMRSGERLRPSMLSSGERQLLLLFCNIIPAREKPSIVIVDEPELSLNVKWQRKLVSSLLQSTRESQVQFILATHSVELLAQHKDNVVQLLGKD